MNSSTEILDVNFNGRLILGSGRSGTTWVQDCLAFTNRLRPIFEPLHESYTELGKQFAYRTIPPGDVIPDLQEYFLDLALGRFHSLWTDYRGIRHFLLPPPSTLLTRRGVQSFLWMWRKHLQRRSKLRHSIRNPETLIKCIRANLMAGWICRNLRFRTVLLVRHPCACIESQHRNASVWDPEPVRARYRSDNRLHEITEGRYLALLNSPLTTLQASTLNWVIENQEPIARAAIDGYSIIHYEALRHMPSSAWPELCAALQLNTVPSPELLRQPSQQSFDSSPHARAKVDSPRWQKTLRIDDLREIQGILDATGCDLYDVANEMPLRIRNGREVMQDAIS